MFSNLSDAWRRRLRLAVALWAVALVALVPLASAATVAEQVPAQKAAGEVDALVGEAAGYLSGDGYTLAVGPLDLERCTVTPLRPGLRPSRILMIEYQAPAGLEGLADRLELEPSRGTDGDSWAGTTAGYVNVRLTATEPGVGRLRVNGGCRPAEAGFGAWRPATPEGGRSSWSYGTVECAGGGRLESWTTPSQELPLSVETTGGHCR